MKLLLTLTLTLTTLILQAKIWTVSPSGTYQTANSVSGLVNNGDTVYIQAALYSNHLQTTFSKDNLLIKGINGRPRLEAGTSLANNPNGKAIFVISGNSCRLENIEFANAAVPDHNGAGVRQEGCALYVRDCYFNGNEMGILGGALPNCKLTLEHNYFLNNGSTANPGYQHNIYIGHIDSFICRYNYSINAIAQGHELKSRAYNNIIAYNFIANISTEDSRTIDLPNGGTAAIIGNIIEQGQNSSNSNLLGYGMEGLSNPGPHNLWVVSNSFINKKTTGSFIQTGGTADTLFVKNNLFLGAKTGGLITGTVNYKDSSNNLVSDILATGGFVSTTNFNYHLQSNSPAIDKGITINKAARGYSLKPMVQYLDTANFELRPSDGMLDIGAFEFQKPTYIQKTGSHDLFLYPNPVLGNDFAINAPMASPFVIYSIDGRYVMGGIFVNERIDVTNLPAGIYCIKINHQFLKFIKQ